MVVSFFLCKKYQLESKKGEKSMQAVKKSLKGAAKQAKERIKPGFWAACQEERERTLQLAVENGENPNEASRRFKSGVEQTILGVEKDEFYERVKELLLSEGEVSDAIGRLTDHAVYDFLTYDEKQRYTLDLSERYLRALKRFKKENGL